MNIPPISKDNNTCMPSTRYAVTFTFSSCFLATYSETYLTIALFNPKDCKKTNNPNNEKIEYTKPYSALVRFFAKTSLTIYAVKCASIENINTNAVP
jgi:hypothetical protein